MRASIVFAAYNEGESLWKTIGAGEVLQGAFPC
jgi:hypothetical protein